jgi:hypothetical protein
MPLVVVVSLQLGSIIKSNQMRCCPVKENIMLSPQPIRAKSEWRVGTNNSRGFVPCSAVALAQVSAQGAQQ